MSVVLKHNVIEYILDLGIITESKKTIVIHSVMEKFGEELSIIDRKELEDFVVDFINKNIIKDKNNV